MTRISAILAALALCGCTQYETRPNPLAELIVDSEAAQQPLSLPERPEPIPLTVDGTEYVAFDGAGRSALLAYMQAAEGNTEIAAENAQALDAMRSAYEAAVRAGSAEHELAELRGRMLHEERQQRWWDVGRGAGTGAAIGFLLGLLR